jgi:hypothetical protein
MRCGGGEVDPALEGLGENKVAPHCHLRSNLETVVPCEQVEVCVPSPSAPPLHTHTDTHTHSLDSRHSLQRGGSKRVEVEPGTGGSSL